MVPRQDFGNTSVRDSQLPRYVARSDAKLRQFYDAQANGVREGSAVHEHTTELVHLTVLLTLRICKATKSLVSQNVAKFVRFRISFRAVAERKSLKWKGTQICGLD